MTGQQPESVGQGQDSGQHGRQEIGPPSGRRNDPIQRAVAWVAEATSGHEFAEVTLSPGSLTATGVAIGIADGPHRIPYRLDYELETGPDFVTRRLSATSRGDGWRRALDLRRAPHGAWTATVASDGGLPFAGPGGDLAIVAGALDCDLQGSPLTNTMPVLRDRLLESDGTHDYVMAWVAVPGLAVVRSRQRYMPLRHLEGGGRLIRYVSLESDFVAEVSFDADGLVVDYPQLGRRLSGGQAGRTEG